MKCVCGAANKDNAKICTSCGKSLAGVRGRAKATTLALDRNPILATALSVVIPGVGQIYNGDTKKGIVMLLASIILGAATAGLFWIAFAVWAGVDAYRVASRKALFAR